MGETPAVAATSLIVGALRWRREDFWFNLFSGDSGVAAPRPESLPRVERLRKKMSGRPQSGQPLR
jgi:hypothetical protein